MSDAAVADILEMRAAAQRGEQLDAVEHAIVATHDHSHMLALQPAGKVERKKSA